MVNEQPAKQTPYGRKLSAGLPSKTAIIDDPVLAERVGAYLLSFPETFAWYTHDCYDGHTLKRKGNGWFLVVRATIERHRMVCFTQGDTIGRVFRQFAIALTCDQITWHPDQYG